MTHQQPTSPLHGIRRTLLDFAPLVGFFIAYRMEGLMAATLAMVLLTAVTLGIIYVFERRVALLPLLSGVCVLVFGVLTLVLDDELFIKLRPTIVNAVFGTVLLVGVYRYRTGWMKHLFGFAFQLNDRGWWVLSRRWGFFFFALALLNEVVWRSVPTDVWVNVKVFGYVSLTMLFTLCQWRLVEKYSIVEAHTSGGQDTHGG